MLKIGISACFFYPDDSRTTFSKKTLQYWETSMPLWVMEQGAYPVLLPEATESFDISRVVEFTDGLLLHGGADVAPETYGETTIDERWPGDVHRDQYEIALYNEFRKQKKPVLGICRGLQVINVAHGGTLYQDINSQKPDSITHRDADRYDKVFHDVDIYGHSLLSKIYGEGTAQTNSVHHQAVKDLGRDLVVEAVCPHDGIIEGFRLKNSYWDRPDEEFVMAVQWHPEFMLTLGAEYLSASQLMKAFLNEVKLRVKNG